MAKPLEFQKRDALISRLESSDLVHLSSWQGAEVFSLPGGERLVVFNYYLNDNGHSADLSEFLTFLCVNMHAELVSNYLCFSEINSLLAYGREIDQFLPESDRNDLTLQKTSIVIRGGLKETEVIIIQKAVSMADIKPNGSDEADELSISGADDNEARCHAEQLFKIVRQMYASIYGVILSEMTLHFERDYNGKLLFRSDSCATRHLYFAQDIENWLLKISEDRLLRYRKDLLPNVLSSKVRRRTLVDALVGQELADFQREYLKIEV